MEASEYGVMRGTCLVARRLEGVAIAGLLWISWCVWVRRYFSCLFSFDSCFLRTHTACCKYEAPRLIYPSTSVHIGVALVWSSSTIVSQCQQLPGTQCPSCTKTLHGSRPGQRVGRGGLQNTTAGRVASGRVGVKRFSKSHGSGQTTQIRPIPRPDPALPYRRVLNLPVKSPVFFLYLANG